MVEEHLGWTLLTPWTQQVFPPPSRWPHSNPPHSGCWVMLFMHVRGQQAVRLLLSLPNTPGKPLHMGVGVGGVGVGGAGVGGAGVGDEPSPSSRRRAIVYQGGRMGG